MSDRNGVNRRQLFSQFAAPEDMNSMPSTINPGTPMSEIIESMISRRSVLRGSLAAGAAGVLGVGLTACGSSDDPVVEVPNPVEPPPAPLAATELNFESVATSESDFVVVPEGHSAQVLFALGDPLNDALPAYANDGSEAGIEFDNRAGDHHDGIYFFGMNAEGAFDPTVSDSGVICVNHENITEDFLHIAGQSIEGSGIDAVRTDIDEVRKEQRAHGVSCFEVQRLPGSDNFEIVLNSPLNRRITTLTQTQMEGPAAGSSLLQTAFSPDGTIGRGTINNCGHGFTPWGTYLACEENYDLYFRHDDGLAADEDGDGVTPEIVDGMANFLAGIGVRVPQGLYLWSTVAGDPDEVDNEFGRWNVTPTGATA